MQRLGGGCLRGAGNNGLSLFDIGCLMKKMTDTVKLVARENTKRSVDSYLLARYRHQAWTAPTMLVTGMAVFLYTDGVDWTAVMVAVLRLGKSWPLSGVAIKGKCRLIVNRPMQCHRIGVVSSYVKSLKSIRSNVTYAMCMKSLVSSPGRTVARHQKLSETKSPTRQRTEM